MIHLILLIFAFVLFAIASWGPPIPPRYSLVAAGLAFWSLSEILKNAPGFP
jgi:CHASE2 domain-containing sensor protein